jgi:hypothetical protein
MLQRDGVVMVELKVLVMEMMMMMIPMKSGAMVMTMTTIISQHVGQLRGRIEGFCALHLKLRDFFCAFVTKT